MILFTINSEAVLQEEASTPPQSFGSVHIDHLSWVHYTDVPPSGTCLIPGGCNREVKDNVYKTTNNPLSCQDGPRIRWTLHGCGGIVAPHWINGPDVVWSRSQVMLGRATHTQVINPLWMDRSECSYAVVKPLQEMTNLYGGFEQDFMCLGPVPFSQRTHIFYREGSTEPDITVQGVTLHQVPEGQDIFTAVSLFLYQKGAPVFLPLQDPEAGLNGDLPCPPNIKLMPLTPEDASNEAIDLRNKQAVRALLQTRTHCSQDEILGRALQENFPHFGPWVTHKDTVFGQLEEDLQQVFGPLFYTMRRNYEPNLIVTEDYRRSFSQSNKSAEEKLRRLQDDLKDYPETVKLNAAAWQIHMLYWMSCYSDLIQNSEMICGGAVKKWIHEMNHPKDPEQRQKDIARRVFGATL